VPRQVQGGGKSVLRVRVEISKFQIPASSGNTRPGARRKRSVSNGEQHSEKNANAFFLGSQVRRLTSCRRKGDIGKHKQNYAKRGGGPVHQGRVEPRRSILKLLAGQETQYKQINLMANH